MPTPEAKVKAAVKKWLQAEAAWFFMPVSNGMGTMGIPDFICCIAGKFVAIECKAPGKRGATTALQDYQIAAIHKAGGAAIVVDDVAQLVALKESG